MFDDEFFHAASALGQRLKRGVRVLSREPAETHDVAVQDGREPGLDALLGHRADSTPPLAGLTQLLSDWSILGRPPVPIDAYVPNI